MRRCQVRHIPSGRRHDGLPAFLRRHQREQQQAWTPRPPAPPVPPWRDATGLHKPKRNSSIALFVARPRPSAARRALRPGHHPWQLRGPRLRRSPAPASPYHYRLAHCPDMFVWHWGSSLGRRALATTLPMAPSSPAGRQQHLGLVRRHRQLPHLATSSTRPERSGPRQAVGCCPSRQSPCRPTASPSRASGARWTSPHPWTAAARLFLRGCGTIGQTWTSPSLRGLAPGECQHGVLGTKMASRLFCSCSLFAHGQSESLL